jgi:hypothetical protein
MMNWKGLVGSGRGLILRYYRGFRWTDSEKPRKTSIKIAGRRGRDMNSGRPEYEAGVLTNQSRCSVLSDLLRFCV